MPPKDSITAREFELSVTGFQTIELKQLAQPVRVMVRDGKVYLYAIINRILGDEKTSIYMLENEEEVDFNLNLVTYIDSFALDGKVYHVFVKDRVNNGRN